MTKKRQPNYLAKLIKLNDEGKARPGVLTIAHIYHDDWCAFFKGEPCNCSPDITLEEAPQQNVNQNQS